MEDQATYAYLFLILLGLGLVLFFIGRDRIGNDPLDLREPYRSWDLPLFELGGAFISGLAGGGLLGIWFFGSAWTGVGIGLVSGTVAAGWTYAQRSQEWAVRSIEDTLARPPGLADFIGETAQALETIAAGSTGTIRVIGANGDPIAVIAVADADVGKGAVVTITGTRGLNLVVSPARGSAARVG